MTEQFIGKFGDGKRTAVIAICNLSVVQNKAYATHLQFAYMLAKDNPDFEFILYTPYRMTIANFRNSAANFALQVEAEFLMFIDDDSVLVNASHIFKQLKDKIDGDEEKHIIVPVTYVRGYPFEPMFFKWSDEELEEGRGLEFYRDFKEQEVGEDKLLEVAAIGCHTCLIKTEVFKNLTQPFFLTTLNNTEDVYFCMKCRDTYEQIGMYVDTSICSSHLLDPLYVNDENVEILREMYKKFGYGDIDLSNFQSDAIKNEVEELGEDFEQ